jgi:drug/metabolite transporter (DMT)-like permease
MPSDAPSSAQPNPLRGITLKVMSVTVFVGMASCIKAAGEVPAGQIVFYRSFFAIFPILLVLAFRKEVMTAFHTKKPVQHIVRGLIGVSSMSLGFYALTKLPLPEAITLNYAQPLLVVVIGALFLGETIRIYRWSAVVIGLIGVLIISWPRLTLLSGGRGFEEGEASGVMAALAAAAIAAVVVHFVRRLVVTERTATIVLWFSVTASVAGLATLPFGWHSLSAAQVALLIGSGLCGGLGQMLMTESYRHADMATIAPFEYTSMILGIVVGYTLFGDVPTINMLVGGTIVVCAGLMIIWREHRLGLERARARKVTPPQ